MLSKHILSLLFLCCSSSLFAQCISQWTVPSSSGTLVLSEQGIEKQLNTGGSRAYTDRPLPSGVTGNTSFDLSNFGTDGTKLGTITVGAELDDKEYSFTISNSKTVVLNNNGENELAYRDKEAIAIGDEIKLERYSAGIALYINGVFTSKIALPASTNKTNIFIELEMVGAQLSKPTLDFGCGIEVLDDGCKGQWDIVQTSSLVSIGDGQGLWKTQRSNTKATLTEALPKNTDGEVSFQVTNWGTYAADKSSIIQLVAKTGGVKYSFSVGSNGMIVPQVDDVIQKVVDIGKLIDEKPSGPILTLKRDSDKLSLLVNDVVVQSFTGLANKKTKFWVKLKKKDMEISSTTQTFACNGSPSCTGKWELARPEISLLEVLDGGSRLLRYPSLKKKANLEERLASSEEGSVLFRITDFGNLNEDQTSTLDFGIKVNGVKHYFAIGSNGMIIPVSDGVVQKVTDIGKLINADPYGPVIKVTRLDQKLELYVNDVLTSTIDGVADGETLFWTKLKGPNLHISHTIHDFGECKENALPIYAELKEQLDASYYIARQNLVYFYYYEEYRDGGLTYTVYDPLHNPVTSGLVLQNKNTSSSIGSNKTYGSNQFLLDLTAANLTQEAYYILEVQNDKDEVWKLRFRPTVK